MIDLDNYFKIERCLTWFDSDRLDEQHIQLLADEINELLAEDNRLIGSITLGELIVCSQRAQERFWRWQDQQDDEYWHGDNDV